MSAVEQEVSPFWQRVQELGGAEEAAKILTAELGKPIDKTGVQRFGRKRMPPKAWRQALRLDDEQTPAPEPKEEGRRSEVPPRQPADAKLAPSPLAITLQAKERIEALHVFAGSSIATAADPVGFQNGTGPGGGVAAIWADKSGEIAQAWIAWAEEGNRFAQSFVRLMGTGGAGGNLILGYAALLGGTAYILGQLPDNDATRLVYGRYSRFRTDPHPGTTGDEAGAAAERGGRDNGAAPPGSTDSLVVPPVAAG